MGQGRSRHVYAFQPLPWPESLHAFRLIDQICGIATTYATTHLEGHAVRVLDKVGELQRLPFQWEVFEPDFERLRGSHLITLATELHSALDKLEGCKYDMGMLAEKGLMFKSLRKAADKVLVILTEVEQIHRAFHYTFELALYESVRDTTPAPPGTLRANSPARSTLRTPVSGGGARSLNSSGGGARGIASSGRRQPVLLPPPPPPPEPEDSDLYSQTATTSPRPQHPSASSQRRTSPSMRQPPVATPAPVAPPPPPPPQQQQQPQAQVMASVAPPPVVVQRSVRIMNDASTSTPTHMAQSSPAATARTPAAAGRGAQSLKTPTQQSQQQQQQYVVVYLPQGPGSSGPRAILVPSDALQPAPTSPAPSAGGAPPSASLRNGTPGSPYSPYAPPPPPHMPTTTAVGGYGSPRGAAGFGSPYAPQPQHTYSPYGVGAGGATAAAMPRSAPPAPAGSVYGASLRQQPTYGSGYGSGSSPYTTTTAYPTSGPYGHTHTGRPGSPPAYKYFSPPASPPSPPLSYATSPPPQQYNPYAAPYSPANSSLYGSPAPAPPPHPPAVATMAGGYGGATANATATAVPAVVPGAVPGSVMVLQPVSATMTSSGAVVLQPTMGAAGNTAAPPMLVVAQDPDSVPGGHGTGSPARQRSVRFSPDYDNGLEQEEYDSRTNGDMDEPGGGEGASGGRRHHSTYTYVAGRNVPYQAPTAVPSYLTPYFGELSPRPDEEGRGGAFEDWEGEEGRVAAQSARARLRSGGGAASLMSKYRDLWSVPAAAAAAPQQQPSYLVDAYAGGGTTALAAATAAAAARPQSRTASPRPRRESELVLDGAAVAGLAPPPPAAVHSISYERLAALAGLDPAVLGAGAAAGLTERRRSAGAAGGATATAGLGSPGATAVKPYVVPGEEALRKMEGLLQAAEDGDWAAVTDMAALIRAGWWGDGRDAAVARGLLLQAALRGGSVEAHAALGDMAERGEGLPGGLADPAAAARHYAAAAAGGHRDAATAYAYLLEHGLGVAQDEARAAQMYAAAAQRGCPTAANNLAKMILDGRGGIMQVPGASGTRSRRRMGADGVAAPAPAAPTPVGMAMALFRRAADAGSASAWYNLGVCHLQQIKQQQASLKKLGLGTSGKGGGSGSGAGGRDGEATPVLLGAKDQAGVAEAIRCLAEAASRGHARAALRAGHLHLLRSSAAAAVDAFATAALNAAAAMAAAGGGSGVAGAAEGGGGEAAGSPAAADAAEVEAEALWCLAQLAERQSAVLEGRAAAALAAAGSAPASSAAGSEGTGGGRPSGDGAGGPASRMSSIRSRGGLQPSASGNSRHSGSARGQSGDGTAAEDATAATLDDDMAVGQLLATLAGTSPGGDAAAAAAAATAIAGGDAISDEMAAAAAADPAAAAALRFAKELCRLDFECCRQPGTVRAGGALTTAAAAAAGLDPAGVPPAQRVRGLRRLRRQAREVIAESSAPGIVAAAVPDSGGDGESRSSMDGGAGLPSDGPVSAALARLDLQLQQPGERATRSRRAAAELMAAAAARGHAGAQHWLAGWQWSMGHTGGAAALWQAAAARGHGPSLMVLGQMAEAGHLLAAAEGGGGQQLQTTGRGADLAAAARYYLRAQEAGAPGALEAMRRVQRVLQRHVTLQGRLEAVAIMGGPGAAAAGRAAGSGGAKGGGAYSGGGGGGTGSRRL